MKEKIFYGLVIIASLAIFISFLNLVIKNNSNDKTRCLESSVCKVGLKIIDNEKEVIITKDYCLKNNYKWIENTNSCYLKN